MFRRTFLNAAVEFLPITRRTPPSVREKEASAMRAMRVRWIICLLTVPPTTMAALIMCCISQAREDVTNYKKPVEERLEDIQRPKSLAEWYSP